MPRRSRSRASVVALQVAIAVLALVPIGAGLAGAILGPAIVGAAAEVSADSYFRYLSGLLLAIGLLFWSTIPRIERQGRRIQILTLIVFVGGLARLGGLFLVGEPSPPMLFGLAMDLSLAEQYRRQSPRLKRPDRPSCRLLRTACRSVEIPNNAAMQKTSCKTVGASLDCASQQCGSPRCLLSWTFPP
jgi:hypothetical protein